MLAISQAQLDAMLADHRAQVVARMTELLRETWPEEITPLGREEARRRVDLEVRLAYAAGLRACDAVFRYVQLPLIVGWRYADRPELAWIDAIFFDPDLGTAEERLDLVWAMLDGQ